MKKVNQNIGLIMVAIMLLLQRFIELPDFIYGLGFSIGVTLQLLGLYSIFQNLSKRK